MALFKKTFNKKQAMDKLMDISVSPYKNTFVEKFVSITDEFFSVQLEKIKNQLPLDFEGIEISGFLTVAEIKLLVGNGHFDDEVSVRNIIIQINKLIYETGLKYLKAESLQSHFNAEQGIITYTYAQ